MSLVELKQVTKDYQMGEMSVNASVIKQCNWQHR